MSEHRADYLVQPIRGDSDFHNFVWADGLGVGEQDAKVSVASEKTWQQIRKNLQEVAEKYLSEVGYGVD